MLECKRGKAVTDRRQDNPDFVNRRFSLDKNHSPTATAIRQVFSDINVKKTMLEKFYREPTNQLADEICIHSELEYVFTKADRFQNIHVDIPAKFVSFVFYIPEGQVTREQEDQNATILYDTGLQPRCAAKFRANSACVFAPQFRSYHGFKSTMDRDVLVMFYVKPALVKAWKAIRRETAPYSGFLDLVEKKMRQHPLLSLSHQAQIQAERSACHVNAPDGRVVLHKAL